MGRFSVKLKITLWYVLVMVFVSLVVFFIMNSVSVKSMEANMEMRISRSVDNLTKHTVGLRGDFSRIRRFELFNDGVQMAIYDDDKNLLCGLAPFGISDEFEFEENVIRKKKYNGNEYYEFDRKLSSLRGQNIWIKGVMSVSDENIAVGEIAKYNLIFIVIMTLIAAAGGYYITSRTLSPVNKIQKTAQNIIQSKDLKQRIELGEGSNEFHRLANTFDKMLDEIELYVEREQQFISDASHELRTPVAVIMSECEYMENYAGTVEELKESAASVKKQSEKMSRLISELLAISRMDKNTQKMNFEETNISELAELICGEQQQIHENNIILETDIAPDIIASADKIMISRVFINLISNAYKYNKENGKIYAVLYEKDGRVVFSVKDSGIGIKEENIPKIWERFFRADEARTADDNKSMGLGLSMVKWIAQKHNGNVSVKSEFGKGSEFIFEFPKYINK